MKTGDKHLKKVTLKHQRDWVKRVSFFLLAYRASTHKTTGMTAARFAFRRAPHLT
jgi:hypothetical protein